MVEDGRPSERGHCLGALFLIPFVALRLLLSALYIRSAGDEPHIASQIRPGQAKCGVELLGSQKITEAQALVHLDDRRCPRCFPHHTQTQGRGLR